MKSTGPSDRAPLLIFTYGNQSRGDDGLGPAIFDLLDRDKHDSDELGTVELLTDYQLQIEHAIDLEYRESILFVDAGITGDAPYQFHRLHAERDNSYSTHAMNPVAVLDVYKQIHHREPPPCYMLTIRGYEFGLGQALSEQAKKNLQQGYKFIRQLLVTDIHRWPKIQA